MATVLIFSADKCQPPMKPIATMAFDEIVLTSGTNELSPDELRTIQTHPDYQRFVQLKAIELIEKSEIVDPQANIEIVMLTAYAEDEAKKIINNTVDLDVLDVWLKNETRAKIRTAIATRISQVKSGVL